MMGERLTNGRTLYGPTRNHQVTNLERSGQTRVQGPILRSIDGTSKRSRNSAIQSLIVQSNPIDSDCPLPLLFSNLFIDNAQPCRLRGPGLCAKTCPKTVKYIKRYVDTDVLPSFDINLVFSPQLSNQLIHPSLLAFPLIHSVLSLETVYLFLKPRSRTRRRS